VFVARYQMSSVQMKMVFVNQLVAGMRPTTPHVCHSDHAREPARAPVCTARSSPPRKLSPTTYLGSQVQGTLLAVGSQAPTWDSSANVATCSPGAQPGSQTRFDCPEEHTEKPAHWSDLREAEPENYDFAPLLPRALCQPCPQVRFVGA
jgi:hypothetical protein